MYFLFSITFPLLPHLCFPLPSSSCHHTSYHHSLPVSITCHSCFFHHFISILPPPDPPLASFHHSFPPPLPLITFDPSLLLSKNESIQLQASFLRKNHRDLRLATLACLDSIMQVYGDRLAPDLVAMVMEGLPSLISDSDLHIALVSHSRLNPFPSLKAAGAPFQLSVQQIYCLNNFCHVSSGHFLLSIVIPLYLTRRSWKAIVLAACNSCI